MTQGRRWVILDRDGVINQDSDQFIKSVDEWIALPGSIEAIARLRHAGWPVAVATNQSGIARGLLSVADLDAMHGELARLLAQHGAEINGIFYCPHGPGESCACRKPLPGLYEQASQHLGLALRDAVVVGDSLRDLQAAAAVGAQPVLVLTGKGAQTQVKGGLPPGTWIHANLAETASALLTLAL
jgi:D-glycero-D-manno-heptose 1,7-bisphosphate phosphatase